MERRRQCCFASVAAAGVPKTGRRLLSRGLSARGLCGGCICPTQSALCWPSVTARARIRRVLWHVFCSVIALRCRGSLASSPCGDRLLRPPARIGARPPFLSLHSTQMWHGEPPCKA
jgi:hypothetical protein